VVQKQDKEDDRLDPFVVQDLYDLLVDVTSPEVTERLRVAGFDMQNVGLSRDVATAACC
jgi:type IV secretory pathway VirB4 component